MDPADLCPVDLNALAWLEDYLQTWPGTLVVVCVPPVFVARFRSYRFQVP